MRLLHARLCRTPPLAAMRWRAAMTAGIAFAMALPAFAAQTNAPRAPAWLDTTPPAVTALPAEKIHNAVFQVILTANEAAAIYAAVDSRDQFAPYVKPIAITREGSVIVYYYAEDDYGNRSAVDSSVYVLDTRAPEISVVPPGGVFGAPVMVRVGANEPCKRYLVSDTGQRAGREIFDSLILERDWSGYALVVDQAGNRRYAGPFSFVIDTSRIWVKAIPAGGIFRSSPLVRFEASAQTTVWFSFDPLAPAAWFQPYRDSLLAPAGISVLRFYGRHASGRESEIQALRFVVDTIPPKLRVEQSRGDLYDTIRFICKEPATIYYALNERLPSAESEKYQLPLLTLRKGRTVITAAAVDSAGNWSEMVKWEGRYDTDAPTVTLSSYGGLFNRPIYLSIFANEPARIFYTLDGSAPSVASTMYAGPIVISKEGTTVVRCIAIDDAGNISNEHRAAFVLDTKPPLIRVRIESDIRSDSYQVTLNANERCVMHYEIGGPQPSRSSPVYEKKLTMTSGQVLHYFAVDEAGNASDVKIMDDLLKPMVAASRPGGVYAQQLKITFIVNTTAAVYWRLDPDTLWHAYKDTIYLEKEGVSILEYFSRSSAGIESPKRRNEYFLDWTPPRVEIGLKKAQGDSVAVFFSCSENASIFYTTDGTNPAHSPTVRVAANKHMQSNDRIMLLRGLQTKLAYYAEDVVGNQSTIAVIDLAKPRVIPNIPPGIGRIHNKFLSVSLATVDERAKIYYARHGHTPTTDSAMYTGPILLTASDTILAFVIDASGYRGEIDTLIYLIDLPPVAQFALSPPSPRAGEPVAFDAFRTVDQETPIDKMLFRWDFDGDGVFDTDFAHTPLVRHTYANGGWFSPLLEVKDQRGRTATTSKKILLEGVCPDGMAYVADENRRYFCIDRYEWPNRARHSPMGKTTWVEAKIACFKAGKRLCTPQEWESACRGSTRTAYPYGSRYEKGLCPTEGSKPYIAGSFSTCGAMFGANDMVGNVWEWVDGGKAGEPLMMGGSYASGASAHCGARMVGSATVSSEDIGFRCCR